MDGRIHFSDALHRPLIGHVCQILTFASDDEENNQFYKFAEIENGARVLFEKMWISSSSLALYPQMLIASSNILRQQMSPQGNSRPR